MGECNTNSIPLKDIGLAGFATIYRGIPLNLIINLIIPLILLSVFLCLRKAAWNLMQKNRQRDVQLKAEKSAFYSFPDESLYILREFKSFGGWLKSIFSTDFQRVKNLYGRDTLIYLRFQVCTIIFLTIVNLISIGVILPLNLMGQHLHKKDLEEFEHSTLANISKDSSIQWVHFTCSFLLFALANAIGKKFSGYVEPQLEKPRNVTLMLQNVPMPCEKSDIINYFAEAFGDNVKVEKVIFTYSQRSLHAIKTKLDYVHQAVDFCTKNPETKLYKCCWRKSDKPALLYYQKKIKYLEEEYKVETKRVKRLPLDIVFVTLDSIRSSQKVHKLFQRKFLNGFSPPKPSILLKPQEWKVDYAPPPSDIMWMNLTHSNYVWIFKFIIVNLGFILFMIIFTTPQHTVYHVEETLHSWIGSSFSYIKSAFQYFTSFLVFVFSTLLPFCIGFFDKWLGFYKKSKENKSIMIKTYLYLLLTVVILPTFGITYMTRIFRVALHPEAGKANEIWKCFFLPDSGAALINYTIFVALSGNSLELIRLPEIFMYLFRFCCRAKSKADKKTVLSAVRTEFSFGEAYAQYLLMVSMTVMFSFTCPLIAPFGLLYAIVKFFVDKHNLFYVYKPSKANKSCHLTAISMLIFSTCLQLAMMFVYSFVYDDILPRKLYISILLIICIFFFGNHLAQGSKCLNPIDYVESALDIEQEANTKLYNYEISLDEDETQK